MCNFGSDASTSPAGAPIVGANGGLTSFVGASGNLAWSFQGGNQHVYEIVYGIASHSWGYIDVTVASGAPVAVAASGLSSFVGITGNQSWDYEATNQHIYEIVYSLSSKRGGTRTLPSTLVRLR